MAEGGQDMEVTDNNQSSCSSVHERGYAAFVINMEPKSPEQEHVFPNRFSAREDVSNLQTVFIDKLGLSCINSASRLNLEVGDWNHTKIPNQSPKEPTKCCQCLCCHIQSLDHSKSDCFVLAISSHGEELTETEIVFTDGGKITLTEIFNALSDEKCPSLKGKPRIILLQACRGHFKDQDREEAMQDRGVELKVKENTQSQTGKGEACGSDTMDNPNSEVEGVSMVTTYDYTLQMTALNKMPEQFLLVYPTVSGQLTPRNETDGSWLIHALKEVLQAENNTEPINFLHVLTRVAGHVSRRETYATKRDNGGNKIKDEEKSGFKSAICIHHRLTKPLVFFPQESKREDIPPPASFAVDKVKKDKHH